MLARRDEIVKDLRKLVPEALLIADAQGRRTYESDALTAYRGVPLAVLLPTTTEDVSKILRYCHQHRVKVVPRGAGTSLCGGALPLQDSIVLGISRMNRVLEIDPINRVARVETGITNIGISQAAAAPGLLLRARSVEPACLHACRQYRHQRRRCALSEIRRDRE